MNSHGRFHVIWEEFRDRKVLKVALVYAVMGWGVMQVGELLFDVLQLPEGSYSLLVILILLGFPMAMVLAWAYEITPEGVRRDVVSNLKPVEAVINPALDLTPRFISNNAASIAILPFSDMTEEQNEGHFSDGLAEEIQNELCKVENLNVVARSHSAQFGGAIKHIDKIAKKLQVCAVLEGSVRRSDGILRISVQLVSVKCGMAIWSRSFDFQRNDDLGIQKATAQKVAESIRLTLQIRSQDGSTNWDPVAYDYFLRGIGYFRKLGVRNNEYARQMFQHAIEHEPSYSRAWAGLAYTFSFECMNFNHHKEIRRAAVAASKKAMLLNNHCAEAHVARGMVKSIRHKTHEADKSFAAAVAIDPNNFEAWYFNACNQVRAGEMRKAIDMFDHAALCDEKDYQSLLLQSQIYVSLGEQENSRRVLKTGITRATESLVRQPDDYRAMNLAALAYLQLGENEVAEQWMSRSLQNSPQDAIIEYNAACFYSLSGDRDRSLECLVNCRKYGLKDHHWFENDSNLDAVRAMPAFRALITQIH